MTQLLSAMRVLRVDAQRPDRGVLREASELLRAGGLVAFPTETVYGLGAHALDPAAVRRIYDVKGRPAANPLIVHVAGAAAARALAAEWTSTAEALAIAFWPGPLTLVVRKASSVPDITTAGQDSVGLRVPSHPVALALLDLAGIPVAAPSANLSTQLSPTTARHVERALGDRVDMIVDGGATTVGIESTVVDATGAVPRILRPGMLSEGDIERVVGTVARGGEQAPRTESAPRSPGLMGRHYAPRARVRLFASDERGPALAAAVAALDQSGRVGAMTFTPLGLPLVSEYTMPRDPVTYAQSLYATLHAMDDAHCELVLIELPPETPEWAGIIDRLRRTTILP